MATNTLSTRIVSRNDTAANWTSVNPVLMKGEIGIEIDTRKLKIGDGVKKWAELAYSNVLPEELSGLGYGDMLKSDYDSNNNGKVDRAEQADNATLANEAVVARKLKTPVTIAGVSFDGSANISLTKTNVGLGNVDNTSDLAKPISTATQTALDAIKGNAGTGVTLGTVDAKATANAGEIATLKTKVSTAEGKITNLETLTASHTTKITAVENKAKANETAIAGLDTRVEQNESDIASLQSTSTSYGTRLTAVEKKATDNATAITAVTTRVTNVEKKATDNATAITGLTGRMTTAESNITSANTKITTLEGKVDVAKVSTAISSAVSASEAKLGTAATKNVGTSSGNVVGVESNGKINVSLIPSVAITDTFTAANEAGMLALSDAEKGDVCIRTDLNKTFILKQNGYNVLANWAELKTPTDAVLSVNGQTGTVNLTTTNISEGSNKYYTEARASANFRTHASTELTDTATILRTTDSLILNGGNA